MFHRGCGQRGLDPDAADPYLVARQQHRTHGQEHHDAEGHQGPSRDQPRPGEAVAPYQGQCRICLHSWRPCRSEFNA